MSALAAAAVILAQSVSIPCGPRDDIITILADDFGEEQISYGLRRDTLMEVWVNEETQSWTIVTTDLDGVSCIFGGTDYQTMNHAKGDPA